ncbi:peptidoglycan glycosyltransferase [Novosphingobium marinum]|uniref:Penicillin-binding protein 2 n=1 Tax=Novosphingobium marinum TaxID=1514948 RepID=A0A7Z0BUD1_9SPHN|nr:penicillin-binding protein 2 [Novosphingobium marinum]NYH94175.1 penicillin-binding protein 2 [Novosphingobium marinum]GGC20190.1 peptidoglycan glycosyltransferase [Novosphingobium marinum]
MFGKLRHVSLATLRNSFDRRSAVLGTLQGTIGVLLAARLGYLAVAQNEKWELEAESNRVNLSLIPPRRGWILDRNGAPLASNRADFRVDIIPDRMGNNGKTIDTLGELLNLDEVELRDLRDKIEKSSGFAPVEVASGLDLERFAAVSVRLPELPGVVTQRGYSRFYPTGPSVGHLIGYVGTASAEDYEEDRNPLLITPGYKIGKDGLEKQFEKDLRGYPGARRVEVTASGRIIRDLETREDVPGKPVKLTIDGPLQDYAARRLGPESGSVVVMDCHNGDILCASSMPSFDPNSFSDGIGRIEWKMLSDDDHVPLRNKVLRGLYPPGSTVKPMVGLAFLEAGLDPEETVFCGGGLRVGNRVFHCWNRRGHGTVNMAKGIYQSCDVYFYYFAQKIGMNPIAAMARKLGLGAEYPLPVVGQSYGTVPDPQWKERKYGREWQTFDTVNATIGQGYFLVNPLQQCVMASRIASGRNLMPRLIHGQGGQDAASLDIPQEHLDYIHQSMSDVVNGPGTAGRARLPIEDVKLAGKTGTAQVVSLSVSSGKTGPWKYRDHGHFICYAPFDKPRYACAVTIEHGGGSGAAYPVARDVMTFLYDPGKAMEKLYEFEEGWGGTARERLDRKYAAYVEQYGPNAPKVGDAAEKKQAEAAAASDGEPSQPIVRTAQSPRPEPGASGAPSTAPEAD